MFEDVSLLRVMGECSQLPCSKQGMWTGAGAQESIAEKFYALAARGKYLTILR